jgi:hypothetical protein
MKMATGPKRSEAELRRAMRDPRYWQSGHPERAAYVADVTRGFQELYPPAGGEGGSLLVHVRSYERRRNGQPEHVSDYHQRRARGAAPPAAGQAVPAERPPAAVAAPRESFIAFVGGAGDGMTGNVRDVQKNNQSPAPGVTTKYYSHEDVEQILNDIRAQPPGTRIVLVGHSWGGDTAARVAAQLGAEGRPVDLLVTVDPVGNGNSEDFFTRVRAGSREWINVQATGGSWHDPDNLIARIGNRYGSAPQRFADQHMVAPYRHRAFDALVRYRGPDGRSPLERALSR